MTAKHLIPIDVDKVRFAFKWDNLNTNKWSFWLDDTYLESDMQLSSRNRNMFVTMKSTVEADIS